MPPLIIIRNKRPSFYGERGSQRRRMEDASRYVMRAGIAKTALTTKATGKEKLDARGTPFRYSNEAASRHSTATLEGWTKGRSTKAVVGFGRFS